MSHLFLRRSSVWGSTNAGPILDYCINFSQYIQGQKATDSFFLVKQKSKQSQYDRRPQPGSSTSYLRSGHNRPFWQQDILTSHNRKSTGVTKNTNDGPVIFKCLSESDSEPAYCQFLSFIYQPFVELQLLASLPLAELSQPSDSILCSVNTRYKRGPGVPHKLITQYRCDISCLLLLQTKTVMMHTGSTSHGGKKLNALMD